MVFSSYTPWVSKGKEEYKPVYTLYRIILGSPTSSTKCFAHVCLCKCYDKVKEGFMSVQGCAVAVYRNILGFVPLAIYLKKKLKTSKYK